MTEPKHNEREAKKQLNHEGLFAYFDQMTDENGKIVTTAEWLADTGMLIQSEVLKSQRPAIEAEAVREFVRRVNETVNDETAGAYGVDWDTAIECVAAEMGISLEGE